MGLDPALIDASGDPQRKNPAAHETSAPPYLHSEGKAVIQDSYLADDDFPTEDELKTLRRVPAKIPLKIYSVSRSCGSYLTMSKANSTSRSPSLSL